MISDNHNFFLDRCQQLALQAAQEGNPPVGAVLVRQGRIISEAAETARTENDIAGHAELIVLRDAAHQLKQTDLSDCVLYSTHEPCVMCAYAIRFHRIPEVVFQRTVAWLGGYSSAFPILTTTDVPAHWSEPPVVRVMPGPMSN